MRLPGDAPYDARVSTERDEGASDEEAKPADRPSAMQLLADPTEFPDDGAVAATLRRIDRFAGRVTHVALFGLLATLVLTAVLQLFSMKLFKHSLAWSFDVVRASTFSIAMIGAAYASHHASHLSMDLVSRKLAPRVRQAVRIAMGLFTIGATSLLLYSGGRLTKSMWNEAGNHSIPPHLVAMMIPVGCGLIILHTTLHLLIDVDYMRRKKLPPEKAPSAH